MESARVKYITRTAMLLAVAVVFQNLRVIPFIGAGTPQSTYIIGILVNLCIILAADFVGIWAAILISVMTPVVASMQGHLQFPVLIPVIAMGSVILSVIYYFLRTHKVAAIVAGSAVKMVALYFSVRYVFNLVIRPGVGDKADKMLAALSVNFGWTQFITALVGGLLAIAVCRLLKSRIK